MTAHTAPIVSIFDKFNEQASSASLAARRFADILSNFGTDIDKHNPVEIYNHFVVSQQKANLQIQPSDKSSLQTAVRMLDDLGEFLEGNDLDNVNRVKQSLHFLLKDDFLKNLQNLSERFSPTEDTSLRVSQIFDATNDQLTGSPFQLIKIEPPVNGDFTGSNKSFSENYANKIIQELTTIRDSLKDFVDYVESDADATDDIKKYTRELLEQSERNLDIYQKLTQKVLGDFDALKSELTSKYQAVLEAARNSEKLNYLTEEELLKPENERIRIDPNTVIYGLFLSADINPIIDKAPESAYGRRLNPGDVEVNYDFPNIALSFDDPTDEHGQPLLDTSGNPQKGIRTLINDKLKELSEVLKTSAPEDGYYFENYRQRLTNALRVLSSEHEYLEMLKKNTDKAILAHSEVERVVKGIESEEPDWDIFVQHISGKSKIERNQILANGPSAAPGTLEYDIYTTYENYRKYTQYKTFHEYFRILGLSHYNYETEKDQLENQYKKQLELYKNNKAFRTLIGEDVADGVIAHLHEAYNTLSDPDRLKAYLDKQVEEKSQFNKIVYDDQSDRLIEEQRKYRDEQRKKATSKPGSENPGILQFVQDSFFNLNWYEIMQKDYAQATMGASYIASKLASPSGTFIIGGILFAFGSPLASYAFAGSGFTSIAYAKTGFTFSNSAEDLMLGIYDRIEKQLDLPFTTRMKADYRGYLGLEKRVDHTEEAFVQYLLDYEKQFGPKYVKLMVRELVRCRHEMRFSDQFRSFDDIVNEDYVKEITQKQDETTHGEKRLSLLLGEIFPPESVWEDNSTNNEDTNDRIRANRVSESEWSQLIHDDPDFALHFVKGSELRTNILAQPDDIFRSEQDMRKLGYYMMAPYYYKDIVSHASKQFDDIAAHSLKQDVKNTYQVIGLGHRLCNSLVYQLGVIALNSANKQLDSNIQGTGIIDTQGQPGFAKREAEKQQPALAAVRRKKKKSGGGNPEAA